MSYPAAYFSSAALMDGIQHDTLIPTLKLFLFQVEPLMTQVPSLEVFFSRERTEKTFTVFYLAAL